MDLSFGLLLFIRAVDNMKKFTETFVPVALREFAYENNNSQMMTWHNISFFCYSFSSSLICNIIKLDDRHCEVDTFTHFDIK